MNTLSNHRGLILEIAAVAAILIMGAFLRFYEIQTRPGFEWDEPVYSAISQNIAEYGYPTFRLESDQPSRPYLYHPPFDFYLKGYWFNITGVSGVGQARILAGIESMALLLLTYFFVRYVADKKAALLALLLVSSDGWLVYTNRLNLLDNAMMPIGLAGLWAYAVALKKKRVVYYTLAGVVLGFAAIYKHTGICFLLVPMINWLLTRENGRHHAILLRAATLVVLAYIAGMYLIWGNEYLIQSWVQIQRTFGLTDARGLNIGLGEIVQAIVDRYWIFFTTIICLIVGPVIVVIRLIQYIRKHQLPGHLILLSWSVVAIAILGIIAARAAHYLIIVLMPLYAFLAAELISLLQQKKVTTLAVTSSLVLALALNAVTWDLRFIQRTDNALLTTYDYVARFIPDNARVLTEECIGPILKQPYYRLDMHRSDEDLRRVNPTYIILYFSTTFKPQTSPTLEALIQRSVLMTRITGFKEDIHIYQVEPERGVQEETATAMTIIVVVPEQSPMPKATTIETSSLTPTPTPMVTPTSTPELAPTFYEVKRGDWLYEIAQGFYGDWRRWRDVYEANRGIIQNPNLIYPGQALVIPK